MRRDTPGTSPTNSPLPGDTDTDNFRPRPSAPGSTSMINPSFRPKKPAGNLRGGKGLCRECAPVTCLAGASPPSRQRDSPVGVTMGPDPTRRSGRQRIACRERRPAQYGYAASGSAATFRRRSRLDHSGPTGAHCRDGIPKFRPRWGCGAGAPQGLSRNGSATTGSFWRVRKEVGYNSVVPSRELSQAPPRDLPPISTVVLLGLG